MTNEGMGGGGENFSGGELNDYQGRVKSILRG